MIFDVKRFRFYSQQVLSLLYKKNEQIINLSVYIKIICNVSITANLVSVADGNTALTLTIFLNERA
ncbi:hypothetical protein (plasmid) [Staphylococcus aureus]